MMPVPALQPVPVRRPVIHSVNGGQVVYGDPAIEIVIDGRQLRGASTLVQFDADEPQPVTATSASRVVVPTSVAGGLAAGSHIVRIIHEVPLGGLQLPHRVVESNAMGFSVRPSLVVTHAAGDTVIDVDFVPAVGDGQQLSLLLNEILDPPPLDRDLRFAELEPVPTQQPGPWTRRSFDVGTVPAGVYLLRARIDGAESRLTAGDGGPAHQVTLP